MLESKEMEVAQKRKVFEAASGNFVNEDTKSSVNGVPRPSTVDQRFSSKKKGGKFWAVFLLFLLLIIAIAAKLNWAIIRNGEGYIEQDMGAHIGAKIIAQANKNKMKEEMIENGLSAPEESSTGRAETRWRGHGHLGKHSLEREKPYKLRQRRERDMGSEDRIFGEKGMPPELEAMSEQERIKRMDEWKEMMGQEGQRRKRREGPEELDGKGNWKPPRGFEGRPDDLDRRREGERRKRRERPDELDGKVNRKPPRDFERRPDDLDRQMERKPPKEFREGPPERNAIPPEIREKMKEKEQNLEKAEDPGKHRQKKKRRPPQNLQQNAPKKSLAQLENDGDLGKWVLVDLKFARSTDKDRGKFPREKAKFVMCRLAHDLYAERPSKMPFFKDLTEASHCEEKSNKRTFNWEEAEEYIANNRVVPLTGIVHHEARVGSTLIANILASNNEALVYSESQPLVSASTNFCKYCKIEDRIDLLQMTVNLMGVSDTHKYLFYKAHPVSITQIELFKQAFPDVPYIWMHRDPVEVMMSQLMKEIDPKSERNAHNYVNPKKKKDGKPPKVAPCLRNLAEARETLGLKNVQDSASREEYCAVYLYHICRYAADGMRDDEHGLAVNYSEDLSERFLNNILPNFFNVKLSSEQSKKALEVAQGYSKASRGRDGDFNGDEQQKQKRAWKYMKDMAAKYVDEVYHELMRMEEDKIKAIKSNPAYKIDAE